VQPVEMPIEDILDLHTFKPKDIPDLLVDYFEACINEGICSVRIVHGKGRGILKASSRAFKKESNGKIFPGCAPGSWGLGRYSGGTQEA